MDEFIRFLYIVIFLVFIYTCIHICYIMVRTEKRSPAATRRQRRANRGNQQPSGAKRTNIPSGTGNYRDTTFYRNDYNRYNYGPHNLHTTYTVVDEGPTLTNLTEANELLTELRENFERTGRYGPDFSFLNRDGEGNVGDKKCCNGDGDCCNSGNAESGGGYTEDRNDGDVGGGGDNCECDDGNNDGGGTYDAGDTYDGGDTGGGGDTYDGGDTGGGDDGNAD